jgi:hypothetical protein
MHYQKWHRHGDPLGLAIREERKCSVDGCGRRHKGKSFCEKHLRIYNNHGDPLGGRQKFVGYGLTCSIEGCYREHRSNGYCEAHYKRARKYGSPLSGKTYKGQLPKWIDENAHYASDECLIWPYSKSKQGYGQIKVGGVMQSVHVIMCKRTHGPKPTPDHVARHLCGNGHLGCVNPKHLVWGTMKENNADMMIHGTSRRGIGTYASQLTENDVLNIVDMINYGMKKVDIANQLGIPASVIYRISYGGAWSWLTGRKNR